MSFPHEAITWAQEVIAQENFLVGTRKFLEETSKYVEG